uniref:Uncharacterized protein n=1 Tax=Brassica campestris TaxID=3711 RepID=A0A3P6ANF1_BRACM|nr:unnamed protein product [Brassica rapa]
MNWGQIFLEEEPLATMLPVSPFLTLMNHKANIRALFQSNGWILSQTTAKPEEGREVECCVLEDGCRQCVILAIKISVALIYATTVLELPNKY